MVRDDTVLVGVRPISNLSKLYQEYVLYRFEILEERLHEQLKTERRRELIGKEFDIDGTKDFLLEQKQFIESMLEEIKVVE